MQCHLLFKVLNFDWLFLKLNYFNCNQQSILPVHWERCVHPTVTTTFYSRTTYSRSRPHWESTWCYSFDHVGISFGNFFSWVVKIRFHVPRFTVPKGQFPCKPFHPLDSSGIVDATRWNSHFYQNLMGEAAYMETNPKSPTSVMVSLGNQQCHDTCPQF